MVVFRLVAVGFGEPGERGGEGVRAADVAGDFCDVAGSGVRTTKTWVRENHEAARRFTKSMVEAIAVFKKNPQVAYDSMKKWWGLSDPEKLKRIYDDAATLPRKPYPSVEGIKTTMQIYDSHEMRQHQPEDFFDASFIKELDDSGYIDSLYK